MLTNPREQSVIVALARFKLTIHVTYKISRWGYTYHFISRAKYYISDDIIKSKNYVSSTKIIKNNL